MFRYLAPRLAGIVLIAGGAIVLGYWLLGTWPAPEVGPLIATANLLVPAAVLAVTLGLLGGFALTRRRDEADTTELPFVVSSIALPVVWYGAWLVLQELMPIPPFDTMTRNLLAAGALALPGLVIIAVAFGRVRGAALESGWVLTARSTGLTGREALGHGLRVLLVPMLWVIGSQLLLLTFGTVAIERAFGMTGLGAQAHAVSYDAIASLVLIAAVLLLLVLAARLLLDLRLRHAAS